MAIGVENNMVDAKNERLRMTGGGSVPKQYFHVIAYPFGAFGLLKRDLCPLSC